MTLDETEVSEVPEKMRAQIDEIAYKGTDNRPVWVGSHRPYTDFEELRGFAHWASIHYQFYLEFIRAFVERRGAVLDVGCGAGQNTAMLTRYSTQAIGIDHDEKAIRFARQYNAHFGGAQFIQGSFPEAINPAARYDYIFCIETMEHVPHDRQIRFIQAALDRLEPDGLFFVTTPNEQVSNGHHIGIWNTEHQRMLVGNFKANVQYKGYISNQTPGDGFKSAQLSHHAVVMHA